MGLGLGLFGSIIIGLIAGWLAEKIMDRNHGLATNLIVGVLGGLIGGAIASAFGANADGGWIFALIAATAGAVILLAIVGAIKGKTNS
ncbi:GlsB/YeaQ/YmgE family stress response membrane protein [Corynebacterium camporealensis]